MAHAQADYDIILPAETGETVPEIRKISYADLIAALRSGLDDFKAMPSHALFIGILYPILGLIVSRAALGYELIPLIYPLASGFALIGPFAALGLYELSRRREIGRDTSPRHVLDFLHLPTIASIAALGGLLVVLFLIWIAVAEAMYVSYFGQTHLTSISGFIGNIFNSRQGFELIVIGNAVGLLFAAAAFMLSVISFPLLLDRNVSAAVAMATSVKVVLTNPLQMAAWAFIIAVALILGSLPALVGLAVVVPVLGHASWHLYRRVVEPAPSAMRPEYRPKPKYKRYGAQFPASLFVASKHREDG